MSLKNKNDFSFMIFRGNQNLIMMSNMITDNIGASCSADFPTRAVIEKLSEFIKASDVDEVTGLTNFCYANDPKVDSPEFQENKDVIKECRGIVFDGQKVVMRAFSHTDEYSVNDLQTIVNDKFTAIGSGDVNNGIGMCKFYEAHEGALIRMFNFKGKWFTTTHRKLNAFKSKWGSSESYGSAFKAALKYQISINEELRNSLNNTTGNFYDAFQSTLDPANQYMFLIRNTNENRLVSTAPENPTMYHVGTFVNGELDMDLDIHVYKPESFQFEKIDDLRIHVESTHPADTSGLIVFCPGNVQFRISSDIYMRMFNIRGNQPSVKFRYLQIRMDQQSNEMLRMMYPDNEVELNEYEQLLHDISKKIHTAYMNRFIHKQYVSVPVGEFQVIRTAHGWFLEDRDNRRVTFAVIRDIVNEQKPTSLNQMIKKHKHDLIIKEKEEKMEAEAALQQKLVDECDVMVDDMTPHQIDMEREDARDSYIDDRREERRERMYAMSQNEGM
jgi:hypothetical protein